MTHTDAREEISEAEIDAALTAWHGPSWERMNDGWKSYQRTLMGNALTAARKPAPTLQTEEGLREELAKLCEKVPGFEIDALLLRRTDLNDGNLPGWCKIAIALRHAAGTDKP